jgi:hypothetical protein
MDEQTSYFLILVGITLLVSPLIPTKENLMRTEGFEGDLQGNFDEVLTHGAIVTQQSQHVLSGSQAALVTNEGLKTNEEGMFAKNHLDLPDAWFIVNFKFVTIPQQNDGDRLWLACIWGPQYYASTHAYFGIKKQGDSTYWILTQTTNQDSTDPDNVQPVAVEILSSAITVDTNWHKLELHHYTCTNGFGEAYIDDVKVASTPVYDNSFLGSNAFFRVGIMNNGNAPYAVASIAFDDITISSTDAIGEDSKPTSDLETFYGMLFISLQILGAVLLIIGVMQFRKKKPGENLPLWRAYSKN